MDIVAANPSPTERHRFWSGPIRCADRGVASWLLGSASLVFAASLLAACSWTTPVPTRAVAARPSGEPPPPPMIMPTPPAPAPVASAEKSAPLVVDMSEVELSIVASEGVSMESARNLFLPAPVASCNAKEHGFLRVVITADQEHTQMMVDPSSTVRAAMSECVLKALSTIDIDDVLQPSASDSTSQVQSIVNIRW